MGSTGFLWNYRVLSSKNHIDKHWLVCGHSRVLLRLLFLLTPIIWQWTIHNETRLFCGQHRVPLELLCIVYQEPYSLHRLFCGQFRVLLRLLCLPASIVPQDTCPSHMISFSVHFLGLPKNMIIFGRLKQSMMVNNRVCNPKTNPCTFNLCYPCVWPFSCFSVHFLMASLEYDLIANNSAAI